MSEVVIRIGMIALLFFAAIAMHQMNNTIRDLRAHCAAESAEQKE